ncbi:MAG TPA: glycoside hydrolase domain-containing protein, partial [Flavisolibacter sp.]|nr:glycoside hydrolase domain-containing protein [Flavisolibacter sp.]
MSGILLATVISFSSFAQKKSLPTATKLDNLTQYVDPHIGTGFHGHVFLGANVPFGAVQLGPTNLSEGWDWCSGYHYSDSTIIGFAHTHLSGTGIGDLGDISLMPVTGNVRPVKGKLNNESSGYYSLFSHAEEKVRPGYYSVRLKRYNILAELTATERVGFHQYSFPSADGKIIIDLKEGIGWDQATKTFIRKVNDTTISGYRYSKGWATDQRIYFVAQFSRPIKSFAVYQDTTLRGNDSLSGNRVKGVASFLLDGSKKLLVKVGISPVSMENAAANIKAEIPHWNFSAVAAGADASWNSELNRIRIKAADPAR